MSMFISKLCCRNFKNNNITTLTQFFKKYTRQACSSIEEEQNVSTTSNVNKYTNRSYTCGELRSGNIGENVTLCGWVEYQRMNKFIVLRDSYGETQLLVHEEDLETQQLISKIPYESVVKVTGKVQSRPQGMINNKQSTGEIEVSIDELKVLNKAKESLPFNIREFQKAKESLRMQYRYLDLRFPQMQNNLRVRSTFLMKLRQFLINNNFVDVETPTLFKATPGGAQEFVVPTRFPGQFYSLVQSPQQFKQMLMAGAVDRYFQIARCYRDESIRSDRQPEFTQLDVEITFTNVDGVTQLVEELLNYAWPSFLNPIPSSFARMRYEDALENYGIDKPDTRFDFKLKDCTDLLKSNDKLVNSNNFGAYYILFPKEYANLSKNLKETISNVAFGYKGTKLVQNKVKIVKEWLGKISKLLGKDLANNFAEKIKIEDDSVLFFAYGDQIDTLNLMGKVRLIYVDYLESLGVTIRKKGMHFLWITDFPLFEINKETGDLQSAHHPFTMPHPNDLNLLETDPLKVRALAYDLVLNGNEIGGGSIRIHDPKLQKKILEILKIPSGAMPYFLEMLGSGCPPHGGIALGLDRLLSILLNTSSIRDVIAFPKNFEGRDPISGAPSEISERERKIYHIKSID